MKGVCPLTLKQLGFSFSTKMEINNRLRHFAVAERHAQAHSIPDSNGWHTVHLCPSHYLRCSLAVGYDDADIADAAAKLSLAAFEWYLTLNDSATIASS